MSAKPAQLLIIEPANELKFVGPFCTAVSSFMRLTNPTDHVILFKIKTTAPKKYCVRPNCGVLGVKDTIEITIILQPFIFDAAEKNKHKFMVQSMIMPPDVDVNNETLWKECSPDDLMDSKLRCVFELPVDSQQSAGGGAQGGALAAPGSGVNQSTNDTPNKSDSGVTASESQHGANASKDEDNLVDTLMMQELKKLRESECALRHENLLLKENVLRMRLELETSAREQQAASSSQSSVSGASAGAAAAAAAQYQNPYSPPALATQQQIPIVYVAAAIAMAIFGLILGKFVL